MVNSYHEVPSRSPPRSPTFEHIQHSQDEAAEFQLHPLELASSDNAEFDRTCVDVPHEDTASPRNSLQTTPPQKAVIALEGSALDVSKDQTTITEVAVDESPQHTASVSQSHGIFWRSRPLMISCFTLGLIASAGHHLFYSHLSGTIVASTIEQEWNIRSARVLTLS